jgi:pyrroline-5-carboxylate reductase
MIGIIGIGNIGSALLKGLLNDQTNDYKYAIYDVFEESTSPFLEDEKVKVKTSNIEVFKDSKYVFLCVKPYHFDKVASEVKDVLKEEQVLISLAPNFSLDTLKEMFNHSRVVRMMPATSMQVNRGVIALSKSSFVEETDKVQLDILLANMGYLYWTKEEGINQTIGVAGSGIAFGFSMIEAMGQGGIANGLKAEEAYRMAAETLVGAGEMVLRMRKHPAQLRDGVCSPGGLTIKGVAKLEEKGFKSAVIEAVKETYYKAD